MTDGGFVTDSFECGDRAIGTGQPCFVIAEIGINHEGSPAVALEMVEAAAKAGADAVKVQVINPESLYAKDAEDRTLNELFEKTTLERHVYREMKDLCDGSGVAFLGSFNDQFGLDVLDKLDVCAFKIASSHVTNIPLLQATAAKGRPVVLSTGMATESEIDEAISTLRAQAPSICVLHCIARYPTPPSETNLDAIPWLQERFGVPVGFSDHSSDGFASVIARARGACVVERHFSLDPTRPGFDHAFSSSPDEMKELVGRIRLVEQMLGDGSLTRSREEEALRDSFRLSLTARRDIAAGETIVPDMLITSRPGTGISPRHHDALIGRLTTRSLEAGEQFRSDDLEPPLSADA